MITRNVRLFTVPMLSVAGTVLAASLAGAQVVVVAPTTPPPPPMTEAIPPAPTDSAQTFAWQPGHWTWSGGRWAWSQGSYIVAVGPGATWEPGFWERQPAGTFVWVEGHWR